MQIPQQLVDTLSHIAEPHQSRRTLYYLEGPTGKVLHMGFLKSSPGVARRFFTKKCGWMIANAFDMKYTDTKQIKPIIDELLAQGVLKIKSITV